MLNCILLFYTCSAIDVNCEQSLVSMIKRVPLKDCVGPLATSTLQLYVGNVGSDMENKGIAMKIKALSHFQILKPLLWALLSFLMNQRTGYNGKNCRIWLPQSGYNGKNCRICLLQSDECGDFSYSRSHLSLKHLCWKNCFSTFKELH